MSHNCDDGKGPATALLDLCNEVDTGESSLATLYAQRERMQLGNTYTLVGNLHNVVSGYGNDCPPSTQQTDFTRVLTWNVGGGPGTLRDRDKLCFLTSTMLQQHVHIACITEGKVTLKVL